MVKVYKDKIKANAARKILYNKGFITEVVKLAYPKGQYLLYASEDTSI